MESFQAPLSDQERQDLQRHTRERRFARNEVVFHEGDLGDSLHIVERGLFVARSTTPLGHVLTVNVFRPGSVFGELSVLSTEAVRSATVVALTAGRTRTLRRAELEHLRTRPVGRHLDELLTADLVRRNRELTAQVMELLFTPTAKRVQRQLLRLDDLGFADERSEGWLRIGQEELATMTATTRATVNRVLSQLDKDGVVEVARGRLRIVERDRLADRAR